MKKIKVYLQYPWKFPDSPYYKNLIKSSPKEIVYLNVSKQRGVIVSKRFFWLSNFLKTFIRGVAKLIYPSMINAHLTKSKDYDIIHCAHCLSKNKNKPWVADIESYWQMFVGRQSLKSRNKLSKVFFDDNCKKIMPWTESTKKKLLMNFPELKKKLEVVYPVAFEKKIVKKNNKNIVLIFSGRYFYKKGGLDALEAIDLLTKKYGNVYGIFNSEIPENIYNKYSKNKKIEFYGLISQEKLFELYEKSDILVYPGYSDSFGFAYLESMSFGVPIVTVDGFARKEVVEEKKTGYVIDRPKDISYVNINNELVKKIIERVSDLIENKKLRTKMSKECIKVIKDGKFSVKMRNKKLKKIYEDALR